MAQLQLTQTEVNTLLDALRSYISDMSMEISNTDRLDFREHLKETRHTLQGVIDKLEASAQEEKQN